MTPSWMVTVPLCPLYNPGNPRHCVVARGNGAGQSAAAGTTKHTAAAAAEVKVTMGLQAGSIALLGSHHQPTETHNTFPGALRQPLGPRLPSKVFFFTVLLIFNIGWGLHRLKLTFYCSSRFGFELRKRGGWEGAQAVPTQIVPPTPISSPNASATADKTAPSYLMCQCSAGCL